MGTFELIPLGDTIRANSFLYTAIAAITVAFLVLLAHLFKDKNETLKKLLFWAICVVVLINTAYLTISTIYLNTKSLTSGPVHYHADYLIFNCGKELMVKSPTGLANKTGSPLVHVHNDKRMHIEGVILDSHEISLGHFFSEVGGKLQNGKLVLSTDEGVVELNDLDQCPDGTQGVLQVFLYKTTDKIFTQKKLENYAEYEISPFSHVPPGDCIIIEFGPEKDKTDKICTSFEVAKNTGKIYGN